MVNPMSISAPTISVDHMVAAVLVAGDDDPGDLV